MIHNTLKPKPKNAKIVMTGIKNVSTNLFRFTAQASSKYKRKEALSETLSSYGLQMLDNATFDIDNQINGFALASPRAIMIKQNELDKTLAKLKVKEIAKNMYMDDDEVVWHVESLGGEMVITKDSQDEIEELVASFKKYKKQDDILPMIDNNTAIGTVAYISNNGLVEGGIAFANIEGRDSHSQVLRFDAINDDPIEVANLAVIAYEELPKLQDEMDFDTVDPVDYFRVVYSEDPEMVNTLKMLVGKLKKIG